MRLIDTNNGSHSRPKCQAGGSLAWKEKTSEVFGKPSPSFVPTATEQPAWLSSGCTHFQKTPDQTELENVVTVLGVDEMM